MGLESDLRKGWNIKNSLLYADGVDCYVRGPDLKECISCTWDDCWCSYEERVSEWRYTFVDDPQKGCLRTGERESYKKVIL